MTRQVEALIAGAYLSGTNTRRVKRARAALFGDAVRTDWEAWNGRVSGDLHIAANADLRITGHSAAVGIGQRNLALPAPV